MRQFGSGNADFLDGRSGEAAMRRPMGIALLRDALYVTDTGNHALRKISVHDGDFETVLGSGRSGASAGGRSEEHTSELQSLMRISYAVFCLKQKTRATILIT